MADDAELLKVRNRILALDPKGERFARVLRETIDQLLNGEATGRYDWSDLYKTEKTHAGTLVEINLQREFDFANGEKMDYQIAGIEVDCKYSQSFGGWMIPPEAIGHLCLVVWADDRKTLWSAGLVRIRREDLNVKSNRDEKGTIKAENRKKISWIWHHAEMPENILLHLPDETRNAVLSPSSGQGKVNELFRLVQRKRISRGVVRTVAREHDYMARIRESKGRARTVLRRHGILIVGHYERHQEIARQLGVPVPRPGELVSFRVVTAKQHHGDAPRVVLDNREWVLAGKNDPEEEGPLLPKHTAGADSTAADA
ncbi:NaeI family type II restriction endonuclease [Streptomyces sp. CO7]